MAIEIYKSRCNSLVQQVEENRKNIEIIADQPPQFAGKGEWVSGTIYAAGDFVTYNGSSYFSIQSQNTAHQPDTSPTWWQLVAEKGEQGVQGVQGVPGQTGPQGRGVFAASLVDNEFTVYVENSDVPKNGDVLVVTVNPGTGDNLGDVYIVTNATGTTNIPIANASSVGNIRGAQGIQGPQGPTGPQGPAGSGNNVYAHYISFNMNNGGIYNFACMLITDSNTPFTFETFEMYIASNYPGKNFPCSAMTNTDKFCGFYAFQTAASAIRVFSGSGNSMPPEEFTVDALYVVEFNDQVMP